MDVSNSIHNDIPMILAADGQRLPSLEEIIAHEVGHASQMDQGIVPMDDGLGQEDAIMFENAVMGDLGLSPRLIEVPR